MMSLIPVKLWLPTVLGITFFFSWNNVGGEVVVQNGGYTNVLVSFSQNVLEEGAKTVLENLQEQLSSTSEVLRNAVGLRISEVTIIVPRSWNTSNWEEVVHPSPPASLDHNDKADILVTSVSDSVFGNFPHALQFGSCGTPGHQIVIPKDFVTGNSTFPKGLALGREWLKYRYGVFAENGYPGDELYPMYHSIPGAQDGDPIVTDCSNTPIEYAYYKDGSNCSEEEIRSNLCTPEPVEESLENVTSSLMYFHEHIPNMQHVCGRSDHHPHASLARNKHNALCQGQSVWDVLQNSSDFQNPQFSVDDAQLGETEPIKFTYVLEPRQKVVIAWENTHHLEQQGEQVLNAIRNFVYELPKGTKRALFPFAETIDDKNVVGLGELIDWPTDWTFTLRSIFKNPSDGCVDCALNKALEILDSDEAHSERQTIILVTSSNVQKKEELYQKIKNSEVCLILLVFSDDETPEEYKSLSDASNCGILIEISKTANDEIFGRLFEAMESILPDTINDRATKTIETKVIQKEIPLKINIDSSMEKVSFWIFSDTESGSISVTLNDKEVPLEEEISENSLTVLGFYPETEGLLKFQLKYGLDAFMQVRVTYKPGEYISGEIFTEDLSHEEDTQEPVILYAKVSYGAYPVQNAEVVATISRPDGEEAIELKLFDNGIGDPDITANDGVYSRYFTSFNSAGEYIVKVNVTGNELTTAGKLKNEEHVTACCGRSAKEGSSYIPKFSKTFETKFKARGARPENGYKPSRITDLRVGSVTEDKIILVWTAPGAEADSGTADCYYIKYFISQEEVQEFDKGKLLNRTSANEWGLLENYEANMKDFDDDALYYIAIKSYYGNISSDISNIVQIYTSNSQTSTIPETNDPNIKGGSTNKNTVIIIIGVVLGVIVLVMIIYLTVYCVAIKTRNKEKKKESDNKVSDPNNHISVENHVINPISFVPVDTLIKHHNEKTKAKLENKDPPILNEEDFEQNTTNKGDSVSYINEVKGQSSAAGMSDSELQQYPPKSPKRTTNV